MDIFFLAWAYVFFTGGSHLIDPSSKWVHDAPHLHRLAILGATAIFMLVLWAYQVFRGGRAWSDTLPGKLAAWVGRANGFAFAGALAAAYAVMMSIVCLIRHEVFHSTFDHAAFSQIIWSTLQGEWFFSSVKGNTSYLGDHFSPIVALFSPLFLVWDDPRALLIAQAVIASLNIVGVYAVARRVLGESVLPKAFALAFFLYLPTRNAVRYDFHVDLLADPLIFLAFYLVLAKRFAPLLGVLGVLLLIKENMAGVVFAFGAYMVLMDRRRAVGLALMAAAPAAFWLETRVLIERVLGMPFYHNGLFSRPLAALVGENFLTVATASYVVKVFGPVAFLSFASPSTLLLAAPVFFQNTLARLPNMRSIFFHYSSGLAAPVFLSAVAGARTVLTRPRFGALWARLGFARAPRERALALALTAASFLSAGVWEYHIARVHWAKRDAHVAKVHAYLARVPKVVSVRTHRYFAPHLANRLYLYDVDDQNPTQGRSRYALQSRYALIDRRYVEDFGMARRTLARDGYRPVLRDDGFYIFEKGGRAA